MPMDRKTFNGVQEQDVLLYLFLQFISRSKQVELKKKKLQIFLIFNFI